MGRYIELSEKDLNKLSKDTVFQIIEDSSYSPHTRRVAAIVFLHKSARVDTKVTKG